MALMKERIDPYWEGVWTQQTVIVWTSLSLAKRQQALGKITIPTRWKMEHDAALKYVWKQSNLDAMLKVLGALNSWQNMSLEQLATLINEPRVMSPDDSLIRALFALELVDYGILSNGLVRGTNSNHPSEIMVRCSRSKSFNKLILPNLSRAETVAVTGRMDWKVLHNAPRHNMLMVELGLRATELCETGTVLGERYSTVQHLFGLNGNASGDGVVVRGDGLRIVFELTASVNEKFKKKVEAWARLLEKYPLETSGVVVVFVEAADPERHKQVGKVSSRIRNVIENTVRRFPGTLHNRISSRIGFVQWTHWFPSARTVSPDFPLLTAQFPSGVYGQDLWQRVDMADIFELEFTPAPTFDAERVIRDTPILAGIHHEYVDRMWAGRVPNISTAVLKESIRLSGLPKDVRHAKPGEYLRPLSKHIPRRLVWPREKTGTR